MKWSFDGHGINDEQGNRIAKVSCCEPYQSTDNGRERNKEFDKMSKLIAAAPELLEALQGVIHHNNATKPAYNLPESLIRHINKAINLTK